MNGMKRKNLSNIEKHGINFEPAQKIFAGKIVTRFDNRYDHEETRCVSIGIVDGIAIIVVVYVELKEKIRLISARPATKKERKVYYEKIQ